MAKVRSLPLRNYQSGVVEVGPFAFPNGLDGFDLRLGRCTSATPTLWTDPNSFIEFEMFFSFDGGLAYPNVQIWKPQGGGIVSSRGEELAEEVASWRFSPDEPTHGKARITVINGPIRTYLDVTIL